MVTLREGVFARAEQSDGFGLRKGCAVLFARLRHSRFFRGFGCRRRVGRGVRRRIDHRVDSVGERDRLDAFRARRVRLDWGIQRHIAARKRWSDYDEWDSWGDLRPAYFMRFARFACFIRFSRDCSHVSHAAQVLHDAHSKSPSERDATRRRRWEQLNVTRLWLQAPLPWFPLQPWLQRLP